MKIIHLTDYLPGYHRAWGGAEQVCFRLLHLLDKNGYDINVISTKPIKTPQERYSFFFIDTLEFLLPRNLSRLFRRIKYIIPLDPVVFIKFYRFILKTKPDIIHIHNIKKLTFSVIFLAKIFKIPVVASIYDYWYFCLKETLADRENKICFRFHGYSCTNCLGIPIYFKYPLKLRKIFIKFFLNRIDAFIVLSKSSSEIMQRYGIDKEKINIIYQPSSLNGTLPEESPVEIENPCLLFVGNLTVNKGALIAIESFVSVRRQIPNVRLYIVGVLREYANKKYVHILTQILKQHKLESSVFFLDRLTPGKIYSIFRQSDLVIVPEQWPNMSPAVLMEAMIMAKPIVASKIGGIPEFIRDGENGLLADPRDPAEFAKKVIWILENPEEAKKMGEKARIDACKIWEDDTNIKKIIEIYDSLL